MKSIEVKPQIRLPFSRCVELVLSGIQFRLFRAAITVVIISLAGSFLMTMISESLIARRVHQALEQQTAPRQQFGFWISRLSARLTEAGLVDELAETRSGQVRWTEFKGWGGLDDAQLQQLVDVAGKQVQYQGFFNQLSEGELRPLVGRAEDDGIFEALLDPKNMANFGEELQTLSGHGFPSTVEQFQAFLVQWRDTKELRQRILAGNAKTFELARKEVLQGRSVTEVLAKADEPLRQQLLSLGYQMPPEALPVVIDQARLSLDAERMQQLLGQPVERVEQNAAAAVAPADGAVKSKPLLKNLLANELDIGNASVSAGHLFEFMCNDPKGPGWFVYCTRSDELYNLDAARVAVVARDKLDQTELSSVEASVSQAAGKGGFMGFSNRTVSLLAVSFLVCIVGIANAMLMSVTERFREIATMKCLGATDGFIMLNFILESMMQGVAGGIVGVLLGWLLGTLRGWAAYGWMAMSNLPMVELTTAAGVALVISVMISAMAAVYPAWVAARLAPMEAMRIE